MSEGKREGFVLQLGDEPGSYVAAVASDGDASIVGDAAHAVVFSDSQSASNVWHDRSDVRIVPLTEALKHRPKSLGQVAAEAFSKVREDQRDETRVLSAYDQWEEIAQAVVAEHERRKR